MNQKVNHRFRRSHW